MTHQRTTAAQRKAEERANIQYLHISKELIDNPVIEILVKTYVDQGLSLLEAIALVDNANIPSKVLSKGVTYSRDEKDISRRDVRKALGMTHRQIRRERNKAREAS